MDQITLERFFNKVEIIPFHSCWEWTGGKIKFGYGVFQYNKKAWKAHRFSFFIANGNIPNNLLVCHKCDNPSCVRPDHLFLGTHSDNNLDRKNKGRGAFGQKNGRAVITEEQAREIIEILSHGKWINKDLMALGEKYGLRRQAIRNLYDRRSWKHI